MNNKTSICTTTILLATLLTACAGMVEQADGLWQQKKHSAALILYGKALGKGKLDKATFSATLKAHDTQLGHDKFCTALRKAIFQAYDRYKELHANPDQNPAEELVYNDAVSAMTSYADANCPPPPEENLKKAPQQ